MKAKIKSLHIQFVETSKDDSGEWHASEHTLEVDGFDGKATRTAAERELEKHLYGSEGKFYNIISSSAVTKTIEI